MSNGKCPFTGHMGQMPQREDKTTNKDWWQIN